jgi:hypothetical protein
MHVSEQIPSAALSELYTGSTWVLINEYFHDEQLQLRELLNINILM